MLQYLIVYGMGIGAAKGYSSGWHHEVQIYVGQNLVKSAGGLDSCTSHGVLQWRELLESLEEQFPGNCVLSYCMADTASLDFSSFNL